MHTEWLKLENIRGMSRVSKGIIRELVDALPAGAPVTSSLIGEAVRQGVGADEIARAIFTLSELETYDRGVAFLNDVSTRLYEAAAAECSDTEAYLERSRKIGVGYKVAHADFMLNLVYRAERDGRWPDKKTVRDIAVRTSVHLETYESTAAMQQMRGAA